VGVLDVVGAFRNRKNSFVYIANLTYTSIIVEYEN